MLDKSINISRGLNIKRNAKRADYRLVLLVVLTLSCTKLPILCVFPMPSALRLLGVVIHVTDGSFFVLFPKVLGSSLVHPPENNALVEDVSRPTP